MKHPKSVAVPFTEVRDNLTSLLDDVQRSGKAITILRRGKPSAVIISHETYEDRVAGPTTFRLAGSLRVARSVDIDKVLAEAKRERIRLRDKRTRAKDESK